MHLKEIETVLDKNRVIIGYRARRSNIFGFIQELKEDWVVGRLENGCIKFDPNGCPTRKLAREKLHELQIKNKNKEKI